VFFPEPGVIGIPQPEPDDAVSGTHIHANLLIPGERIVV
jgi:hypothetical protein